jgi:glycosyltransferase involved in cell wall biosynthesis
LTSNVILISSQENTHTKRWLNSLGFEFEKVLFLSTKNTSLKEISRIILDNFDPVESIILSGPLEIVSSKLKIEGYPHFLLSFGYDIQIHYKKIESILKKIHESDLGGIIVDNYVNFHRLIDLGFREERIHYIPWGVEKNWLERKSTKKINIKRSVFISPRSHENLYRIDLVVKVFNNFYKNNPKSRLLLLGEGSKTNSIIRLVNKLSLHEAVNVVGRVSEKEYKKYLKKSDFYISATEVDGSSVSLLQAMALGVIPIVSDIPANSQWIKENITGYKFAFSSAEFGTTEIIKK